MTSNTSKKPKPHAAGITPAADATALRHSFGYIDQTEFYVMLGIGFDTGVNRRLRGDFPPTHKVGQRHFFKRADIEQWLARRRVGGPKVAA